MLFYLQFIEETIAYLDLFFLKSVR
jgi:hypothetical protein